jgi:hypothetical protein
VGSQHFGDVEEIEHTNHVTPASDRDDFHVREFPSQRGGGLQAILIRHENIHNDDVGRRQPIMLKGLFPITGLRGVIAGLLQCLTNQSADLLFVVNDKNRWHRTSTSMQESEPQFPTGCAFKESLPNCTITTVGRQTNNAASLVPIPDRQRCEHA